MTDEAAQKLGEQLEYILRLRFEVDGKFHTPWGPVSHKGLARVVADTVEEFDDETA